MRGVNSVNLLIEGGSIQLMRSIGNRKSTLTLDNVVYFPEAPMNLISINVLRKQGHKPQFTDTGISIAHNSGQFSIHGTYNECGMLVLESLIANSTPSAISHTPDISIALQACNTPSDPAIRLIHERMGHLGEQNVKKLANIVDGIDTTKPQINDACEPCTGKQKAVPHSAPIQRGEWPMDLVHSDVKSPITGAYNGVKHIIAYMDEYSEVYLEKQKNATPACFQKFKRQKETGTHSIRRLRVDGGGGYASIEFQAQLAAEGIKCEVTVPGSSQMNGKSERFLQSIMGKAVPLLKGSGLPQRYWPEMVLTANYLRVRGPVAGLDITPFEAMNRRKPNISHL